MNERELTKDEMSDREDYVKGMKKNKKDFKKRYGDDAESVMYATATKMAKEGLNETEENSVSDKKENVQAEERQENLNWLEDIKRLSGLDNTYENSADAMKEYKVDESADTEQEVIAESTEEQVDEVMPFVKMTYKEIQDDIERTRLEIELGEREDVAMLKPRLRDLLDMKDVVKVILNNKGWDTEYIVGAMMDSGLDTSVREELAEKFKKQVSKDPQLAKKLFKDPQVDEATGYRADKKGKVDKSEKKHYHCKLTKDDKTKGVRMVADEGESEADVKARCKRENMGWELQSMRKLDESVKMEGSMKHMMHADAERMSREQFVDKYGDEHGEFWDNIMGDTLDENDDKKLPPEGSDAPYVDPEFAKHMADVEKKQEDVEMEGKKKDHDGDGDIDSNDYLAARDKAIKAAIAKKKGDVEEGLAELADLVALAGLQGKVELDELANEPGQGTEETSTYSVSDVVDQGNDLHAKSKQHADKAKLGDNPMATEEVDVVENKLWKAYQAELEGVKK